MPLAKRRPSLRIIVAVLSVALFSAFAASARPETPSEAPVDLVIIEKSKREMTLYRDGAMVRSYRIALGFTPIGDKLHQGDGKTPEGRFRINFKNPNSQFHLSLKISYPDAKDRAAAHARGDNPGGDIFIHGTPGMRTPYPANARIRDWTHGCIAVTENEIEEIWKLVPVGVAVEIKP